MSGFYILDGHKPVPIDGIAEYARWATETQRSKRVAYTEVPATPHKIRISTVFLGMDHRWSNDGPPLLFETMIFEGEHDGYQTRCSTWEEAKVMHDEAVALVEGKL